jgi:16S rRNA (cytidine1402-2'-O)-methyltransferase
MPGTLYIVSTPIGNLEDVTQRALRVLREVDLIACEDTRHTRQLLNHFNIDTRTVSYHEHNERERAEELCKLLEEGKSIALVSDAGTPLISDPGFRIVKLAGAKAFPVVPVPGATAFVAALAASGLASDQVLFAGFLPARTGARRAKLEELRACPATLVLYEAPHRIAATLRDALDVLGNRPAVIARELTKMHEEFLRGSLQELTDKFSQQAGRGEMVLIIGAAPSSQAVPDSATVAVTFEERLRALQAAGADPKTALKQAARELGLKRDEAYRIRESQKNRRSK